MWTIIFLTVILVWVFMAVGYFLGYTSGVSRGKEQALLYFQAVQNHLIQEAENIEED